MSSRFWPHDVTHSVFGRAMPAGVFSTAWSVGDAAITAAIR